MANWYCIGCNWYGIATNNWSGTGISFNARPSDIKAAIDVLHQRKLKVILAVGAVLLLGGFFYQRLLETQTERSPEKLDNGPVAN